ncbi:hypothetical protein D3C79_705540 [compost metagenome]
MSEARAEHLHRLLDDVHGHVARVGLQECTKGRTADDQYFERLDQRRDLAVGKHVSAEHAREYDDDADNFSHRFKALAVVVRGRDGSFKTLLLLIGRTAPDYSHSMRKASSD